MASKKRADGTELELGLGAEEASEPVECLGMTFEDDEARREHFLDLLREKLKDPEFRKTEGFPIGEDEDILALSDPPYYTACPNPFIEDFIRHYGKPYDPATDNYRREPFATDVAEGKSDPIYNAHSYHTKVPHRAIMRYILHYTQPGDVVFDGFCGTGMTGVAAQTCGDTETIGSLGYSVRPDGGILDTEGRLISKLGARRVLLSDLSPAATFIASNYNAPVDGHAFLQVAAEILNEVERQCGWMYRTASDTDPSGGQIEYVVWSDVFICPHCSGDIVFFDCAVDRKTGGVRDVFACPSCRAKVRKAELSRQMQAVYDPNTGETQHRATQVPVLVNCTVDGKRLSRPPLPTDLELLARIDATLIAGDYPTCRIDGDIDLWYERDYRSLGIYSLDAFFTRRNLICLSHLMAAIRKIDEASMRRALLFAFTGILQIASRMSSFRFDARNPENTAGGILKGALYIPSISKEARITELMQRKVTQLARVWGLLHVPRRPFISTQSLTAMHSLPDASVDYLFVDPPFGSNIIYSDLSLPWEAWLEVATRTDVEAVVHRRKKNGAHQLADYQRLMEACFSQCYRVLKPGRWMTVEFHNTAASVWNAIQEALQRAGFVVADVRTLDKQQGTFKQVTALGAVKQDLVISAYKPNGGLESRFRLKAGTQESVWDFTQTHLKHLPVFVAKGARVEVVAERHDYLLFDRMVAFHIMRGVSVPLSASEFYRGLRERFPGRDGMFFLPEQVAEYDRRRMEVPEIEQFSLFVLDERTAIQWLRQELSLEQGTGPQTYQQIQPKFLQELHQAPHEKLPELRDMLEENFLQDDQGRWYVPDPAKQGDLEKLREKALWREFETYIPAGYVRGEAQLAMPGMPPKADKSKQAKSTGRLKTFRTEAVRAGFKQCWSERDYQTIIAVAHRLPETVIQEDPSLLMYYDNAMTRAGSE